MKKREEKQYNLLSMANIQLLSAIRELRNRSGADANVDLNYRMGELGVVAEAIQAVCKRIEVEEYP